MSRSSRRKLSLLCHHWWRACGMGQLLTTRPLRMAPRAIAKSLAVGYSRRFFNKLRMHSSYHCSFRMATPDLFLPGYVECTRGALARKGNAVCRSNLTAGNTCQREQCGITLGANICLHRHSKYTSNRRSRQVLIHINHQWSIDNLACDVIPTSSLDTWERHVYRNPATLGPASSEAFLTDGQIRAGTDVFRLNLSHCQAGNLSKLVKLSRNVRQEIRRPVQIAPDIRGRKDRLGPFDVARHVMGTHPQ